MIIEVTLGDECGGAALFLADIWSEASVRADVCLQISFLVKSLSTLVIGTHKWSSTSLYLILKLSMIYMGSFMNVEPLLNRVHLITAFMRTLEYFVRLMCLPVVCKMGSARKGFPTSFALEILRFKLNRKIRLVEIV